MRTQYRARTDGSEGEFAFVAETDIEKKLLVGLLDPCAVLSVRSAAGTRLLLEARIVLRIPSNGKGNV